MRTVKYDSSRAVKTRLFDPATGKWFDDSDPSDWTATESNADLVTLTEVALAETGQSRYSGDDPEGWPDSGSYIVEYVDTVASPNEVIAEEPLVLVLGPAQTFDLTGNVTGSVGSLAAQAKADVKAEAAAALADYDGPTNSEMEARTLATADYATAANQGVIAGYLDTEIAAIINHLTDIKGAGWTDENLTTIDGLIDTALARLTAARAGYLDKLNVSGTLAHSDAAATYKADVSNLDVAVSTRLAAGSYTAPDNAGVAAIKAKTDNLPADPADQSAVEAAIAEAVGGLNDVSVADVLAQVQAALNEAFTDATSLTANGLKDRLRVFGWLLRNKMEIDEETGDATFYKDDGTTPAFTIPVYSTSSGGVTTRKRAE